jgi:hypothetical protein
MSISEVIDNKKVRGMILERIDVWKGKKFRPAYHKVLRICPRWGPRVDLQKAHAESFSINHVF